MISRRRLLQATTATMATTAFGVSSYYGLQNAKSAYQSETLIAQSITANILDGKPATRNVFTFGKSSPPTLWLEQGQPFRAILKNELDEPTTIHWHGTRLPNDMDGVAFLTQPVVYKGEEFEYKFTPPDAGTYWYHPHCNSLEQLSKGMTGLLIVREIKDPGFDIDLPVNLKDWRLGADGQFLNFYKPRNSARSGTYGTVRTSNWQQAPVYDLPAGSLVRLRLCVTDVTRVFVLGFPADATATVIAIDGNPVPENFPLKNLQLGPGQRADIAIQMPTDEGQELVLTNYSSSSPWAVLTLRSIGKSVGRDIKELKKLPKNPVPKADLSNAIHVPLVLSATAERNAANPICGNLGYSFWSINGNPGSGNVSTDPIMSLMRDQSYVFEFINRTPHIHPVHLHGMSFELLKSNKRPLQRFVTDTALLLPDERMQVALKPDEEGDWLLHCHILEHQATGMTGFFRVE
ncbi:MAG: copper oxidase [Hyphomicrobiales bacterium]|nr:MAG: copper oxidase [Hyphomicrobiales bacterium]